VSEMTVGQIVNQLIITKEQVDEATGKIVPADYKIKSSQGYYEQLQKYYAEEKGAGYSLPWAKTDGHFAVRLGELTILQGVSGHGKSMMVSQIFSILNALH
jgi:ABC-type sugar transport system ATPase subunit